MIVLSTVGVWLLLSLRGDTVGKMRAGQYTAKIKKLQLALNSKGCNILFSTKQFFSDKYNYPMNIYIISQVVVDANTGAKRNVELFSTTNQLHCLLFMRNLWYMYNGKEVPTTNLDEFNAKWATALKQNLIILPIGEEE